MSETTAFDPTAEETVTQEATLDHYIGEIKGLQKHMDSDQQEIETLQSEIRAILADIMSNLRAA